MAVHGVAWGERWAEMGKVDEVSLRSDRSEGDAGSEPMGQVPLPRKRGRGKPHTQKSLPAREEFGRRQSGSARGLRHDAQVRPRRLPTVRIDLLGVLVADRTRDDDLFTLLPVGWRRHLVLG